MLPPLFAPDLPTPAPRKPPNGFDSKGCSGKRRRATVLVFAMLAGVAAGCGGAAWLSAPVRISATDGASFAAGALNAGAGLRRRAENDAVIASSVHDAACPRERVEVIDVIENDEREYISQACDMRLVYHESCRLHSLPAEEIEWRCSLLLVSRFAQAPSPRR